LPGKYSLSCIFRDYASNAAGKMEKNFEVTPVSGETQLLPLLLAMKASAARDANSPFTYNMQQYFPKENSSFNDGQNVMLFTTLLNPKKEQLEGIWKVHIALKKDGNDSLNIDEELPVGPNTGNMDIARKIHLQSLVPGQYTAALTLSRGTTTYTAEAPLKITDEPETLGRIRIAPEKNNSQESYHNNVALQYFFAGNFDEATKHTRIALDFAPSSYPARTLLARIDQAKGNTQEAI